MSIRNEYLHLADYVAGFAHRNVAIEPRVAGVLAMELLKLADQAERMERLTIVHEMAMVYADAE